MYVQCTLVRIEAQGKQVSISRSQYIYSPQEFGYFELKYFIYKSQKYYYQLSILNE